MKYFLDTEFIEGFHKPLFGKKRHFIDLISIGIACEDGRAYYAISKDVDLKKAWGNEWVRENVLRPIWKELHEKERYAREYHWSLVEPFSYKALKTLIGWNGKSNKQISEEIKDLVSQKDLLYPGRIGDLNQFGCTLDLRSTYEGRMDCIKSNWSLPELYGYYADYDWVLFCSLFGTMMDLPKGFPMHCRDLKQMLDEKAETFTTKQLTDFQYGEGFMKHDVYAPLNYMDVDYTKVEILKKHRNYPKQSNEHNALADAEWNKKLYSFLQNIERP